METVHFFIVGGQRCGSTMLAKCLDRHTQIEVAKPMFPEPKYFLAHSFDKLEYLTKYFHFGGQARILGEKSTSYYESEEAAIRINSIFPNARILFILRNPIHRALSNYFFTVANGLEDRTLGEVFIEKKPAPGYRKSISTNPFSYLYRGEYATFIEMYRAYFDKHQIYVMILEELVRNKSLIHQVTDFLGASVLHGLEECVTIENELEWSIQDIPEGVIAELRQHYKVGKQNLEQLLHKNIDLWDL